MGDLVLADELRERGIRDEAVLSAIAALDRSLFMPEAQRPRALYDGPVAIGHGQTISQPYIVAYMTEALEVEPEMKVLEIGTGSGYQGAVLAQIGADVYSVERIPELAATAKRAFEAARLHVHTTVGDGSKGWPEHAPYDRIIVTAAAARTPTKLIDQLARGGKMIAPVGDQPDHQELVLIERSLDGSLTWKQLLAVRFVPLIEGNNAPLS